ncbi:hypothetical protein B0E53_06269 [Micromonospora sp. MH33]|nr:hypothetical protein B0E53_06269 [Micromonospora sp. MH33]
MRPVGARPNVTCEFLSLAMTAARPVVVGVSVDRSVVSRFLPTRPAPWSRLTVKGA